MTKLYKNERKTVVPCVQLALAARHHRTGIEGRVDGWKWNSVAKNLLVTENILLFDLVCGKVWKTFYKCIIQAAVIWLAKLKGIAKALLMLPSECPPKPTVPWRSPVTMALHNEGN